MTEHLTDYMLIKPTMTTAMASNIASPFHKTWYQQFGFAAAIMSDRNKLFVSCFCRNY